jgi:hypothetical protein
MASPRLSRRAAKVVRYPPLSEMSEDQRRGVPGRAAGGRRLKDLPGKWQAAILMAEQNRRSSRLLVRRD